MVMTSAVFRILVVDFLDSYTNNIAAFIRSAAIGPEVYDFDIRPYNSLRKEDVVSISKKYHGIVLSAGPGTVDCADDLGSFVPALFGHRPSIPVYGICLGFQAICKHFGASIRRLKLPHHGLVSNIEDVVGKSLGRQATRYHSLEVELHAHALEVLEIVAVARNNYDYKDRCIMEIKHRTLPFWGVQYHPESVYSSGCEVTVRPFLRAISEKWSNTTVFTNNVRHEQKNAHQSKLITSLATSVVWRSAHTRIDLLQLLLQHQIDSQDCVLLDSGSKGEWDVLAASNTAKLFRYSVQTQDFVFEPLRKQKAKTGENMHGSMSPSAILSFLEGFSSQTRYADGPPDVPFWGGFLGYFSYEFGLAQLGLGAYHKGQQSFGDCNDIHLLWSTETLVYNKHSQTLYAMSLQQHHAWVDSMISLVEALVDRSTPSEITWRYQYRIVHPAPTSYISSISACQEEIRAGNSYELCLTAASHAQPLLPKYPSTFDPPPSTVQRFHTLRQSNPAEFSSFLQLNGTTLLSVSPEEFLNFNPSTRTASMKPIKGTHPKAHANGNPIALAEAESALKQPKVIAENLMIVDLVRNDLAKVSSSVTCPDLMKVEDIGSMYQLVSTVSAETKPDVTAWDLLSATLPPGSMTGAPKRRSCEILQRLEGRPRGIYSGVIGYVDVRGSCRFSVNIRNAVQYPGEAGWWIGAGGAITALSDPESEWQERQLKAHSAAKTMQPGFEVLETVLWDPCQGALMLWDEHVDRLTRSIRFFGFDLPLCRSHIDEGGAHVNGNSSSLSARLAKWIESQPRSDQKVAKQRLSITISAVGIPSITAVPIAAITEPVRVHLDPYATLVSRLEPFISHKTTKRAHYTAARERAGVQGRDEVLLFRPVDADASMPCNEMSIQGRDDDLLTEGSYTNVVIGRKDDSGGEAWITPASHCLPGLMREKLLRDGLIREGEVRRRELKSGMKVRLCNSVRGVFEGIIE